MMASGPPLEPFGHEPVEEIMLVVSPLADVLAQVRFPPIASLARQEFLGSFQEAMRKDYPVLREERQLGIVVSPEGVGSFPQQAGVLWRLTDVQGSWNITVATNFIALETKEYVNREDFFRRLHDVLAAFQEHVKPNLFDRLGVRYVNRLVGAKWLDDLAALVRPEVLGLLGDTSSQGQATMNHGQQAIQYQLESALLLVRAARLPAGATYDPTLEPVMSDAWLLDIDMSFAPATPLPFDADGLTDRGRSFAEAIYRYFRWSVTPEFLRRAGGDL